MPEFILDTGDYHQSLAFAALDAFTQGYIEAMFFTNQGDSDDEIPKDWSFGNLAPETLAAIVADCAAFQAAHREDLDEALDNGRIDGYDEAAAGRDYWYTRCGHGVGFWDRNLGDIGETMSEHARKAGEKWVQRGDDGLLYLM